MVVEKKGGQPVFGPLEESEASNEREVSCRVINSILKYLESQGYQTDLLIQGLPYSKEYLCDPFNWVNHKTRDTLCQRAAELTKNEAVMYQIGLSSSALKPFGGLENLVKLIGSPKIAYCNVAKFSGFFDHTLIFKATPVSENKITIDMSLPEGYMISKSSCYFA
jgi:hypothetical protein